MAASGKAPGEASILSPLVSDRLCELWLQGHTLETITGILAAEFPGRRKLTRQVVSNWINDKLRPVARKQLCRHLGEFLQEIYRLKAWAYRKRDECSLGLSEETIEMGLPPAPAAPPAAEDGKSGNDAAAGPPPPPENDPARLHQAIRKRKRKEPKRTALEERELVEIRRTLRRIPNLTVSGYVDVIKWCLEQEAKIAGHFLKSQTFEVTHQFRVSGRDPNEVDRDMLARVQQIAERVRQEQSAVATLGSPN